MQIKNIRETEYFTAVDQCRITETFGIPTAKLQEASVAYAIVPPKIKLFPHKHTFKEFYIITRGRGRMYLGDTTQKVSPGDNIYIPEGIWHSIENLGDENLELYCFCAPAFTVEGTTMQDGSEPKESVERNFIKSHFRESGNL